jgi:hypothetical protein
MKSALAALVALLPVCAQASAPCEGVDRNLDGDRVARLTLRAVQQLHEPNAKALRSFAYDGWDIVEIGLNQSRTAFVFFSGDDTVAVWRGGQGLDEVSQAKEWTVENAPGIPNQLARCFAVYVTR